MTLEVKQEQRTFLRERFLWLLTSLTDLPTEFELYDHTHLRAMFAAADVDFLNLQVNNLQTPIGIQPAALLRTMDIISFHVDVTGVANNGAGLIVP